MHEHVAKEGEVVRSEAVGPQQTQTTLLAVSDQPALRVLQRLLQQQHTDYTHCTHRISFSTL